MVEAEAKEEVAYLQGLGFGVHVEQIGKRLSEAELQKADKKDGKQHEENYQEAMGDLADMFGLPKFTKGTVDEAERQRRKAARRQFIEGRAA